MGVAAELTDCRRVLHAQYRNHNILSVVKGTRPRSLESNHTQTLRVEVPNTTPVLVFGTLRPHILLLRDYNSQVIAIPIV